MECSGIPAKIIATSFALVAFAAAVAVGLAAGNPANKVLWRAAIAGLVCYPVGRIVGAIAQKTVQDHIDAYKKSHPIPTDEPTSDQPSTEESSEPTEQAAA
jgi:hypothetical protein